MDHKQNDMTPHEAAAALAWLSEMGADEIVGETAIDRFQAEVQTTQSSSRRKPGPMVESERTPTISLAVEMDPGFRRDDGKIGAAACQTLDDIAAALSHFDACTLKKTATNLCFADGNPRARVMLVGEAPGRDEDIEGKPFVGRSGQLLDKMLAAIGLSRHAEDPEKAVFITNTIFWRPPGNRTPTEAETAMCLPFLQRTIEIQQPQFIVCLGATPAHRLTGLHDGILKLRGKWLLCTSGSRSIPLLPTLHPAYLLRQPAQKRLAWRDLLSLRQALDAR
jgi:uracil-DNA glycosylase